MMASKLGPRLVRVMRLILPLAMAAVAAPGCRAPAAPPPIIVIMVDTLRADYLGAYGFDGDVSPHIDAFAAEAVVFENAFSQAPWTKPSIASLLTSLHPPVHQVVSHEGKFAERGSKNTTGTLAETAVTLAEALQAGGYATGAFVANPWIRRKHGFGQGFDVFDSSTSGNATLAEPVFAAARTWIAGLPGQQPYLAYVHVMDVHGPYDAPHDDFEAVRDSPEFGSQPIPLTHKERRRAPAYLRRSAWVRHGGDDLRVWRGRYAANVHAFDRRFGEFLDHLRADGTLDRAIVLITADHGEQLYEHGGWDHGTSLYDEELHVPLIVRLPGGRGGGHRVESVVSLIDVMPTLLGLAGVAPVEGMQGRDLGPYLEGATGSRESAATFATSVKWKPALHSARTLRYKLIENGDSKQMQLYDLKDDPQEKSNIAEHSAGLKEVAEVLAAQQERNRTRGVLPAGKGELPDRVRERLRSLGYESQPSGTAAPAPREEPGSAQSP